MSEREFEAAICPNQYGSSTGGVIKSTVLTRAVSDDNRYTAASSLVSNPTIRFGSLEGSSVLKTSDKTVGLIFAAHPQVRASWVNVFSFLKNAINASGRNICVIGRGLTQCWGLFLGYSVQLSRSKERIDAIEGNPVIVYAEQIGIHVHGEP